MKRKNKKKIEDRSCILCTAQTPDGRELMLCNWCYDEFCKELDKI